MFNYYKILQKKDVITVKILLRVKSAQVRDQKDIIVGDTVLIPAIPVGNVHAFNYVEGTITLLFLVTKAEIQLTAEEFLEQLMPKLWNEMFQPFYTTDVAVEGFQVKCIDPPERMDEPRCGLEGSGDNTLHKISPRAFVFGLGSNLIRSKKGDFTIRLPHVSDVFRSLYSVLAKNNQFLVTEICNQLKKPITLEAKDSTGAKKEIELLFVFKTERSNSLLKYYPIDKVTPIGFLGNAVASASKFPLNSTDGSKSVGLINLSSVTGIQGSENGSQNIPPDMGGSSTPS